MVPLDFFSVLINWTLSSAGKALSSVTSRVQSKSRMFSLPPQTFREFLRRVKLSPNLFYATFNAQKIKFSIKDLFS